MKLIVFSILEELLAVIIFLEQFMKKHETGTRGFSHCRSGAFTNVRSGEGQYT